MANRIAFSFVALDKFSRGAEKMSRKSNSLKKSLGSLGDKARSAGKKFKNLNTGLKRVGKSMRGMGQASKRAAAALALAGFGSVKIFADMETGITNVLTLLSGDEIEQWGETLDKTSKKAIKLGFSIEDSNKALFDTVSALGVSEAALFTFEQAQKLAIGGTTTLSVAVDGITSVVNAYGKEITNSSDVANAFFTAQKFGKTTVEELSNSIGSIAPVAKQAGIGYKELLATTAQLTLGGLSTDEAVTSLKSTVTALIKPGAEAQKVFKKLGIPFGVTAVRAEGLNKILGLLAIAAKEYPDELARAIPNIRAFTGVGALQEEQLKNVRKIIATINEDIKEGTGLNDAYTRVQATTNQQLKRAAGNFKLMSIVIGEIFAPVILGVSKAVGALAEWFLSLSENTQKAIAWLTAIGTGVVASLSVVGGFLLIIGKGAAFVSAVMAGIISLPALIVAAIVIAGTFIVAYWEDIENILSSGFEKVKSFFGFSPNSDISDIQASLNKTLDVNASSRTQIDVNMNAPKGIINNIQTKSEGRTSGLNVGVNNKEDLS